MTPFIAAAVIALLPTPDTNFPLPQSEENNPNVTAAKANGTLDARGCFPNTV